MKRKTFVFTPRSQGELHPFFSQPELRAAHTARGILTQAWSPLGGVYGWLPSDQPRPGRLVDDAVVAGIAERHGVTAAQVVPRWHLQHGVATLAKTLCPERLRANHDLDQFSLAEDELADLDRLDTGIRGGIDPDQLN